MTSLHSTMETGEIIQLFAEHGFQIEPTFLEYIKPMTGAQIVELIRYIDRNYPNTLVVGFWTAAEIYKQWILVIETPRRRKIWFLDSDIRVKA